MLKLTKKDFNQLHKENKLSLIGSYKFNKEYLLKALNKLDKIDTKKTSNINIDNIKGSSIVNIYKEGKFIFVESYITDKMYGNSIYTVCYLIK